ncbi:DUF6763 family protein [Methylomagnum sp.]
MSTEALPSIDDWFQDAETGRSFRVVAVDDESDSINVQYYNGDIGDFDFSSWRESTLFPIEPPEDASAPFDDLEIDDLGYTDPDRHNPSGLTLDDLLDERDAY